MKEGDKKKDREREGRKENTTDKAQAAKVGRGKKPIKRLL